MIIWAIAAALLLPTAWIASLALSVKTISRSSLSARLAGTRRESLATWFTEHVDAAHLSLSLVRTALRTSVFVVILVAFTGFGEGSQLTLQSLGLAALVAVLVLWFATVVLATAMARYCGENLVASSLRTIYALSFFVYPLRPGVHVVQESVRRLSGADRRELEEEAEAELLRSIEEQQREGGLDEQQATLLENIVTFNQTDVGEVMTPRTDIDGIEYTDDLSVIREIIKDHGHSRMPVYDENLDHILGVLYAKDLVQYLGESSSGFKLRPILREPIVIPESKRVAELLQDFQSSEVHMAIVVDEYGGTAGIVTIEDVLEEIVGEIQDEHDTDAEDLPSLDLLADGLAEVDGRYHVHDLNEEMAFDLRDDEEYDTVAGYVLARLGRVPEVGEVLESEDVRFTTLAATSTTIDRLRVEAAVAPDVARNGHADSSPGPSPAQTPSRDASAGPPDAGNANGAAPVGNAASGEGDAPGDAAIYEPPAAHANGHAEPPAPNGAVPPVVRPADGAAPDARESAAG
ncbi:MAG: transporter associated domain-containing protein [Phycisphaerales bacterium]